MYLGKIMELSAAETLYSRPRHPYTSSLLDAIPIPDPDLARQGKHRITRGEPPSPTNPPPGCRFSSRCRFATDICHEVEPPLALYADGDLAACHHPLNTSEADRAAAVRSDASPLAAGQELKLTASREHESQADTETSS
jgi:oligopeptide/dipeptide ABC transporter ATP-binding protein